MVLDTYPRQFRNRVAYSVEDLKEYLKKYLGMGNCTISLYSFREIRDKKPVYSTAIIDSLLVEVDYDNGVKLDYVLEGDKTPHIILFDGEVYNFIIPFKKTVEDLNRVAIDFKRELEEKRIDGRVNAYLNKMVLYPNTLNLKNNKLVLILKKMEDKEKIEKESSISP